MRLQIEISTVPNESVWDDFGRTAYAKKWVIIWIVCICIDSQFTDTFMESFDTNIMFK